MLARVNSSTVIGIDGHPLAVEVDNSPGKFIVQMVGLPDAAVRESQDRVLSAIRNSGFAFPQGRVVINLAPADLRKEGSALDLPIALGVLMAGGRVAGDRVNEYCVVGELALDGSLRPIAGTLCMALAAREQGLKGILLPRKNATEAGVVPGIEAIPVENLREAASFISGADGIGAAAVDLDTLTQNQRNYVPDLTDVKGQAQVKRALVVAAAGNHNVLLIGPPGTGKTMLASRLPGILPELTFEEALETTRVYSVGDVRERKPLVVRRPFRAPHHTTSTVAIAGGGAGMQPMPGEVSLAHHGVLFLDELPEFNRAALEVLRQPLEDGIVHVRRANYSVTFPSRFMLVVAMNPCPCGCRTDPRRQCRCSLGEVQRYMNKLSGPLLDRIDIHVEVPALTFDEISSPQTTGPSTAEAREEVTRTRALQRERNDGVDPWNAYLDGKALQKHCALDAGAKSLLETAMDHLGLSARAYDKILRVSRTIADLENAEHITEPHIAEAIQYRSLDREMF